MVLDRLRDEVTRVMITEVGAKDPTRLKEVKIGRFQSDPAQGDMRAAIMGGDLDDPMLMDHLMHPGDRANQDYIGFTMPAREIGGSQFWLRTGTIRLDMFFIYTGVTETNARENAYLMLGRLSDMIEKVYIGDLTDDFGETALLIFHTKNSAFQSGGPPTAYIWRAKLVWEVLTERDE